MKQKPVPVFYKLYSHVKGPMAGFGKWPRDSKYE